MFKTILFTSNPNFVPMNLDEIYEFAQDNDKLYTCFAGEGTELYEVEKGAHILTTKGNNVYILGTGSNYPHAKKQNITGIVSIDYPFGNKKNCDIVNSFTPVEANGVRLSYNGEVCVAAPNGYIAITKDNTLVSYPNNTTIEVPMFIIPKAKEDVNVGDIIYNNGDYLKVLEINGDEIKVLSYFGTSATIRPIKDYLFDQSMLHVLMTPSGKLDTTMLMALAGKSSDSMLTYMLMSQKKVNPMMLMLLSGKKDIKDLLLLSMFSNKKLFDNDIDE